MLSWQDVYSIKYQRVTTLLGYAQYDHIITDIGYYKVQTFAI